MSLFTYKVVPPTHQLEASASPNPDDINTAYIRIEATANQAIEAGDLLEIRFVVQDTAGLEEILDSDSETEKNRKLEANDNILKRALTRNPAGITPVAASFGAWSFVDPEEANVFIARSTQSEGQIAKKAGDTFDFFLYDVEVVDRDGKTSIAVTEVYAIDPETKAITRSEDYDDADGDLTIRKIYPSLRIDYFRAITERIESTAALVELSWATTAATEVELHGPDGEINLNSGAVTVKPDEDGNTDASFRDATVELTPAPQSTSTYTLIAKSNQVDAIAVQQVTITVSDQIETNNLKVTGQVLGNLTVEETLSAPVITATTGAGSVTAKTVTATTGDATVTANNIKASSITARDGDNHTLSITASSITLTTNKLSIKEGPTTVDGYLIPKGGIIMWSGTTVPAGWALCDGTPGTGTPDLRGRFILGAQKLEKRGEQTDDAYYLEDTGGSRTVALTANHLPGHSHSGNAGDGGNHSHTAQVQSVTTIGAEGAAQVSGFTSFIAADNGTRDAPTDSAGSHGHTVTVSSTGSATAHENMPPYYVLAFIMKL